MRIRMILKERRAQIGRDPQGRVVIGKIERPIHNPDDSIRFAVQGYLLAADVTAPAKLSFPKRLAQNDLMIMPELAFRFEKDATKNWLGAQDLKEGRRDHLANHHFRFASARDGQARPGINGESLEDGGLFFPCSKFFHRKGNVVFLRDSLPQVKQSIRLRKRRTGDEERMDNREHEHSAAYPKGEHERDGERKDRRMAQTAEGKP